MTDPEMKRNWSQLWFILTIGLIIIGLALGAALVGGDPNPTTRPATRS